jgi:hypothetical protein
MANPMPSGVSATSTRDAGSIRAEWNAGSSSFSHASGLMRRGVGAVIDQQWASAERSRALSWVPQRSRGGSAALPWRGRLPDRRQRLAPSARPLWRGEPPPRRSRTLRQTTQTKANSATTTWAVPTIVKDRRSAAVSIRSVGKIAARMLPTTNAQRLSRLLLTL